MGNGHSLTDGCPIITSTLSKAIGCCHRVCNARVRFVTRQSYSLSIVAWGNLAHLAGTDEFCIDTLFLLHMHIGLQGFCPLLTCQDDHAGGYKAAIAANKIGEMLEDGKAILCHAHSEIIGVVLPHDSPRPPRCTITKGLSLQQYNTSTSLPGKMIGNAGPHHPPTNDKDIGCFTHGYGLLKMRNMCSLAYIRVPVPWIPVPGQDATFLSS